LAASKSRKSTSRSKFRPVRVFPPPTPPSFTRIAPLPSSRSRL
jgi:hypothetical protein